MIDYIECTFLYIEYFARFCATPTDSSIKNYNSSVIGLYFSSLVNNFFIVWIRYLKSLQKPKGYIVKTISSLLFYFYLPILFDTPVVLYADICHSDIQSAYTTNIPKRVLNYIKNDSPSKIYKVSYSFIIQKYWCSLYICIGILH